MHSRASLATGRPNSEVELSKLARRKDPIHAMPRDIMYTEEASSGASFLSEEMAVSVDR
jgi:hypothetical protein